MLTGGFFIILVIVVFLFRSFHSSAPESSPPDTTPNTSHADDDPSILISLDALHQKILNQEKLTFLDLRDPQDFAIEHIPHSFSITLAGINSFSLKPGEIGIIVLAQKDTASNETVKNILKQQTNKSMFLLQGGFESWKQQGNPVYTIGDPKSFIDQSKVTYITPEEVKKMLATDDEPQPFFLDVQSKDNYAHAHIKGAVNIPLDELEKRSSEVPLGKGIIVYGESELSSFQGGVRLNDLGVYAVKTLTGNDTFKPETGLPLQP